MAIKKSELYSSLWASCDELRGGMDASQYKDYVLVLLFVKYISDKYAGQPDAIIEVPPGGSFADMVALKGDKEIGDKINKIITRLADANDLRGVIDVADFNDADKLGKGKEMVDRLSNLVAIFNTPALDFRCNRTEGDDLLGDAYEYLMRHFAIESGKSKGQFLTPSEVSRVMAKVIGIGQATRSNQTLYDPTCGSSSLLLKAHDEAPVSITIYGQEMDNATHALARMNMILHNCPTAEICKDNTLSTPRFLLPGGEDGLLEEAKTLKGKLTKGSVKERLAGIKEDKDAGDERKLLIEYAALIEKEAEANRRVKDAVKALEAKVTAKYGKLTVDEIKALVVDDKWMAALGAAVQSELDRVSQALTGRIKQLTERYTAPVPELDRQVNELDAKVKKHLERMGFKP